MLSRKRRVPTVRQLGKARHDPHPLVRPRQLPAPDATLGIPRPGPPNRPAGTGLPRAAGAGGLPVSLRDAIGAARSGVRVAALAAARPPRAGDAGQPATDPRP